LLEIINPQILIMKTKCTINLVILFIALISGCCEDDFEEIDGVLSWSAGTTPINEGY
jgi:hypothetical protein